MQCGLFGGRLKSLDWPGLSTMHVLHRRPNEAAKSSHTSKIEHLRARGFIDGMLELMAPGTGRFDAVLEVQRRYQDNDSDSDSSGKPPPKKAKLTGGSPQAKKATSKPASQAKKPARMPRGGRGKGKAATGRSAGVQAADGDIRSFFVSKPDPASRKDDGGDGEDDSDLMDLDK